MAQASSKTITISKLGTEFRRVMLYEIRPLPLAWVCALIVWSTLINLAVWAAPS